ncbi:PREDICTED: putative nuclease HARBI1, partial [Vollenhovia emeryi]|uniref:putative nuclease HARBI1 n=1 Tax=Vollenhovia emeryi TaxID=411798 RepID=UPI0005F4C0B3
KRYVNSLKVNTIHIHGIVGAIDGCHIRIRRPKEHEEDYVNRKGFHSILLQGVCDYNKLFIDVHIGESGSLHDARVLKKSSLYRAAEEDPNFFNGCFLLGDSAYPNLKWLAPPFKNYGQLTENEIRFNVRHSSARSIIEHAFGLLKSRFRRLFYFNNLRTDIIIQCVMAACILHNICILTNNYESNVPEIQIENNAHEILNARERMFSEMFH